MVMYFTVLKAKRRIRRYIKTGVHQPRVYDTNESGVYEYKVKHHVHSLYFRRGVFNRVRLLHDYTPS